MDGESIITWNMTNFLTVIFMVAVGFGVLALGAQLFHKSGLPGSAASVGNSVNAPA